MKSKTASPTPYADINVLLDQLLSSAQVILSHRFTGLYLHGSLAYGDFNPQTSDIDFVAVTDGPLPTGTYLALKELHTHLFTSGLAWAQKIEGAYIPKETLRRHDPNAAPVPWLGADGHFALEAPGSDWMIQRRILREKGVVVAGPPLKPMIDPVSSDDLREAVRTNLRDWWSPPLPAPERFQRADYQAYAVLTMCRSLYVLEHGRIASKPEAARWALETLEEPWRALVAAAASWRPGKVFDRPEEMVDFIRFTLGAWGLPARNPE